MKKKDHSLETYAANAPVTGKRELNTYLEKEIEKPYLARALEAVDCAHPNGTEGKDSNNMSVLQQHVAFFDRNNDGKIYPWETFQGSRAIGCGVIGSFIIAIGLGISFTYTTRKRILSTAEWWLLYRLGKDEDGLLRRETIRGIYDGSLFEHLERRRNARLRKD